VHGGKHGKKEIFETKVRPEGFKVRRTRDARVQAGQAEERPQRQNGEEPQAGHRNRTLRSARRGREGAREEVQLEEVLKEEELDPIEHEKEIQFQEEIIRPQEVFFEEILELEHFRVNA
jgi:hypothetical protein